jgi:large subunit ribosomal protein L29
MKRNEKKELREKTIEDLQKTLGEYRKEFFDLRMEKEKGQLKNTRNMTNVRKKIAITLTILNQKEKEAQQNA